MYVVCVGGLWDSWLLSWFTGNGRDCAKQLARAHPDKFKISDNPAVGAIFSCIGRNHVGIVIGMDGTNITIQEGDLDGKTNTFEETKTDWHKTDWHTKVYALASLSSTYKGMMFAVRK